MRKMYVVRLTDHERGELQSVIQENSRARDKPYRNTSCFYVVYWFSSVLLQNYFFEWMHWWAYVVMGVSTPGWLLTWIGPIGMGWALLKITGIPWTERQALASRGEDYRDYQRTTSSFIPWFPKTR